MSFYLSDTQIHIHTLFISANHPSRTLFILQYLRYILSSYATLSFALMDSMFGNCRAYKSGSRILIEKAAHAPMSHNRQTKRRARSFLRSVDALLFRRSLLAISVCRLFDKTIVRSGEETGYCCNNVKEIPYIFTHIYILYIDITQCACKRKY